MNTLTASQLQSVVRRIVEAVGTPPGSAQVVADLLVGSHLAGHDSHGVQHLPRYINEVHAGAIRPAATPKIVYERGAAVLVSGNWGWGHVTTDFALQVALDRIGDLGTVVVGGVQVNHIGRLGHYVERAAAEGVITILMVGFGGFEHPTAAPYGGRRAVLSPNPIAMGFPTSQGDPIVVDYSTTAIAGGKVLLAEAKGEPIPSGVLIDKDGNPSTNPGDWLAGGALLPFGAHKGFAIMAAAELLGRILSGADEFAGTGGGDSHNHHAGLNIIAIDSGVFGPRADYAQRAAELAERIRAVPPASGFDEVLMPGDFERNSRKARKRDGITIPASTWQELSDTATSLGLAI